MITEIELVKYPNLNKFSILVNEEEGRDFSYDPNVNNSYDVARAMAISFFIGLAEGIEKGGSTCQILNECNEDEFDIPEIQ
jgi:hypothetical protein